MSTEVKIIGQMDNSIDHTFESANRVYDSGGLSPTLPTCAGGNIQPKILVRGGGTMNEPMCVASRGRNPDCQSDRTAGAPTEQRLEVNQEGVTNCLTSVQKDCMVIDGSSDYRIRKLTPLECFRLQGTTDEDAKKMLSVNSNSQCYKQAGNSICVDVLCAMFRNLNIKGVKTWNEYLKEQV